MIIFILYNILSLKVHQPQFPKCYNYTQRLTLSVNPMETADVEISYWCGSVVVVLLGSFLSL